jgi:hypothetical protein
LQEKNGVIKRGRGMDRKDSEKEKQAIFEDFVKSLKMLFAVIPVKTGIQSFR